VKTFASEQTPEKRGSEKGLSATGTFPVSQPRREKEVENECKRESKWGNEKEETYLQHRDKEERKDNHSQATVRCPRPHKIGVDLQRSEFGFFQGSLLPLR
jgi:hypothetical protein